MRKAEPKFDDLVRRLFSMRKHPEGGVYLPSVTPAELWALASALHAVNTGRKNPSEALGLPKREGGRPSEDLKTIALRYYGALLHDPTLKPGVLANMLATEHSKSAATITRIARAHRDWALQFYAHAYDVSALRAHLETKSKGGNRSK